MEQDNKYYTPDIQDLYVGYECELYGQSTSKLIRQVEWYNFIFSSGNINKINKLISSKEIRTKYLDKTDIESLGWIYNPNKEKYTNVIPDPNNPYKQRLWFKRNEIDKQCSEDKNDWYNLTNELLFTDGPWGIQIYIIIEEAPSHYRSSFAGKCKSINELKKIMTWLNINN